MEPDKTQIEENLDMDLPLEHIADELAASAEPTEPAEQSPLPEGDAGDGDLNDPELGRASQSPDGRVAGSIASPEVPWLILYGAAMCRLEQWTVHPVDVREGETNVLCIRPLLLLHFFLCAWLSNCLVRWA